MNSEHNFDEPIKNPDHDLLGMKPHAEKLANFIAKVQTPFIIGVYGQWGEGKSSYVELTKHYLGRVQGKEVKFVEFSAWPYTTSDELWHALTVSIAREVCKPDPKAQKPASPNGAGGSLSTEESKEATVSAQEGQRSASLPVQTAAPSGNQDVLPPKPDPQDPPPAAKQPDGFLGFLSGFLMQEALVVGKQEEEAPPDDPCADVDKFLKEGLSRSIRRGPEKQLVVNQEAAFRAILSGALAAIGSVSPVLAGLRGFLGLDQQSKLADIVQKEKEKEAEPEKDVDTIDKLKAALKTLFDQKAQGKLIFVFVDDLDRCLPDVALDLLEAIKIFFFQENVPCIFLVAADKALIGQGLRLRYKDLFEQGDTTKTEELLTRKGNEYFEKIVQFGVSVPQRTPEQVHKFITAQYPKWASTTDIITAAIGNNPRRLKQYCDVLSFAYEASHRAGDAFDEKRSG